MAVWQGSWNGNQTWVDTDLKDNYNVIGKRGILRKDGYDKVSGKAVFTRDVTLPGMLYAKYLTSPYANAKILSMDTSAAEAYPGVKYVLRYDDPEVKDIIWSKYCVYEKTYGANWNMTTWLLGSRAHFWGETVGVVVAADTEQIADEAIKLIEVEWEELPFVLDQEEALQPGSALVDEQKEDNIVPSGYTKQHHISGDVEAGFNESDGIVECEARRAYNYGAPAEPISCLVNWGDKLECWFHVQVPGMFRLFVSRYFNLPMSNVVFHSVYQGCQWGQWNWCGNTSDTLPIIGTILSKRTGKPVKILYTRQEEFGAGQMDCSNHYMKIGYKNDGTITAIESTCNFANLSIGPYEHFHENSRIQNLDINGPCARVNKPPVGAVRCEQSANSLHFCLANDYVASSLGMDPTEVALKNDGAEGHDMTYLAQYKQEHGFPDRDSLSECIELGKEAFDWDSKWHEPGARKLANGRMHGVSFTWDHEWQDCCGDSSIGLAINPDGSVSLMSQQSDIGVNQRSSLCQIVAEELGMKYERIFFLNKAQETVTFELEPPEGSAAFTANAWAAKWVAVKAKTSLLEFVCCEFETKSGWGGAPRINHYDAFFPGKTADELDIVDGVIFEKANPENSKTVEEVAASTGFGGRFSGSEGTATGIFTWQFVAQPAKADSTCDFKHHWLCRQANFLEIEVDTETGEVYITKVVPVNDVGKVISPETCEGQQYGGIYMASSRALVEEHVWDPLTGVQLNGNFLDYRIAGIKDVPWDCIECKLVETGLGFGAYGSVGIGELPATQIVYNMGPAIYNALGVHVDDYPITPDKILKALGKA